MRTCEKCGVLWDKMQTISADRDKMYEQHRRMYLRVANFKNAGLLGRLLIAIRNSL